MEIGAQTSAEVKTQVEAVLKTLIEAWNSHDMTLYAAQFAEDADFVNVLGMHWHGREAIQAQHATVHSTIFRNSSLRLEDYSLRPLGPGIVLVHVKWEMRGHDSPPGVPFADVRHGLITGVFVEQEGRWLISAFHNTDIVPMPGMTK